MSSSYQSGFQDGYLGREQRQQRRPYSTGFKRGTEECRRDTNEKGRETTKEWIKNIEKKEREENENTQDRR